MSEFNELNLAGFLETHDDLNKVRDIVNRRGAAFVIDAALKHQRAVESAAYARYQKERSALLGAESQAAHPPTQKEAMTPIEQALRNLLAAHESHRANLAEGIGVLSGERLRKCEEQARAALASLEAAKQEPLTWRCFHCDESFTDKGAAELHFGRSEHQQPACQISIEHVRWLEAQHRRVCEEDTEVLRTISGLAHEHETLRRRAEEEGYARGLADAKKHPEELGLAAAPSAPTPSPDSEPRS